MNSRHNLDGGGSGVEDPNNKMKVGSAMQIMMNNPNIKKLRDTLIKKKTLYEEFLETEMPDLLQAVINDKRPVFDEHWLKSQ